MIDVGAFSLKKRCALAALFAVVVWLCPVAVGAHAEFIEASPSPGSALTSVPAEFRLTFTEAVDPELSSIALFSADGSAVPSGAVDTDPEAPEVLTVSVPASSLLDAG